MIDINIGQKYDKIAAIKWGLFLLAIASVVFRAISMRQQVGQTIQAKVADLDPGLLSTAESFGIIFTALVDIFTIIVVALVVHVGIKLVFLFLKKNHKRKLFNDCALISLYLIALISTVWNMFQ